jgi:hypothetical protein
MKSIGNSINDIRISLFKYIDKQSIYSYRLVAWRYIFRNTSIQTRSQISISVKRQIMSELLIKQFQ